MAKPNSKNSTKPKATKAKATAPKTGRKPKKSTGTSNKGGTKRTPEEVQDLIFRAICENHILGMKDTSKVDLAIKAEYTNPRSEGFTKALSALVDKDLINKSKDSISLTPKGVENMPDDLSPPKTSAEIFQVLKSVIETKVKGSGAKLLPEMWDFLADGKPHTIKDVASHLGYENLRSFGNLKMVSALKELGYAENAGKGSVQLTNKAFPGGQRP